MEYQISPEELKSKLEAGENIEVIDIREADEYREWHIKPSNNIPIYDAVNSGRIKPLRDAAARLPKDKPIVLYCRVGETSGFSAKILQRMGFDAVSLEGGMRGWSMVASEAPISLPANPRAVFIQIRRNGKGCLSYLIGSDGEAAIVDPSVNINTYLEIADRENLKIAKVIETHVHADHLSRARDLCDAASAKYFLPQNDRVNFAYTEIRDGDEIAVGDLIIQVIATPGHTGESVCLLIRDEILLTGDTLFVNSVGRPDLEKGGSGAEEGARFLHRSLHDRILELHENIGVFPAHHDKPIGFDGAPIGANLHELKSNLALLKVEKEEFIREILSRLGEKPANFGIIVSINEGKQGLGFANPLDLEAGPNRCAAS